MAQLSGSDLKAFASTVPDDSRIEVWDGTQWVIGDATYIRAIQMPAFPEPAITQS